MVSLARSVRETLSGNPVLHRGHQPAAKGRKTSTTAAAFRSSCGSAMPRREACLSLPGRALRDRLVVLEKAGPERGATRPRL